MPTRRDTDSIIGKDTDSITIMNSNKKAMRNYCLALEETRLSYSALKTQLVIYFEQRSIGSFSLDKIVQECKKLPAVANIPAQGFSAIMAKDNMISAAINAEIKRFIDRS